MRLIVFGGSGFIGNAFLKLPELQQFELLLVTRNPKNIQKYADRGIQAIVWDYETSGLMRPYLQGKYAIINFVGENIGRIWTRSHREKIIESRRQTANLISDLINSSIVKPQVVIQASAIGYYGSQSDTIITEEAPKGKGFLSDVAAMTERTLSIQSEKVRMVYIRSGVVLGKGGGFLNKLFIPFKLYLGGHFGSGKQWMPWIHLEDEIRAILFLLNKNGASGAYNLVSPNPVRMKDFAKIVGKVLYRPSWFHVPAFLLKAVLGDFARELILVSQRAQPKQLLEAGFKFEHTDLQASLEDIYYNND